MELGQRIRQARLEAGLSQKQLCGDTITRNMLSLIENGNARPSMDTLVYLAARLEKSVGYFLAEENSFSKNQTLILQARKATGEQALKLLEEYTVGDPLTDPEYYLLKALTCLELAQKALRENRKFLCARYLEQAQQAGSQTPYYTPDLERRRILLCYRANTHDAATLSGQLPDNTQELLLRGDAALQQGDFIRCAALLDSAQERTNQWYLLRGECFFLQKQYKEAAGCYHKLEDPGSAAVYARLETCYKELEDYKKAYEYALKQR